MFLTEQDRQILLAELLRRIEEWRYGEMPENRIVEQYCDLYRRLAFPREQHVTVEWIRERRSAVKTVAPHEAP